MYDNKYRGISKVTKEWIYGYYTYKYTDCDYSTKKHLIEYYVTTNENEEWKDEIFYQEEVYPDSIDISTGVFDMQGNEIYERDEIELLNDISNLFGLEKTGEIHYIKGAFMVTDKEGNFSNGMLSSLPALVNIEGKLRGITKGREIK